MALFEQRFCALLPLKVDSWGVVLQAWDTEAERTVVLRRLNQERRGNPMAVAAIRAEVEYGESVADEAFPSAELVKLDGPEWAIVYRSASGPRLDWLLQDLERRGYAPSAATALAMLQPVFSGAEAIQNLRPPAARDRPSWGHGEITPFNILIDASGRGRLLNATFAVTGVGPVEAPKMGALYRAPELEDDARHGTPAADVYSLAAVLSFSIFGSAIFARQEPLRVSVERAFCWYASRPDRELVGVLVSALAADPAKRFAHAGAFRAALDECASSKKSTRGLADIVSGLEDQDHAPTLETLANDHPEQLLRAVTPKGFLEGDTPTGSHAAPLPPPAGPALSDVPTDVPFKPNAFDEDDDRTELWGSDTTDSAALDSASLADFASEATDASTTGGG